MNWWGASRELIGDSRVLMGLNPHSNQKVFYSSSKENDAQADAKRISIYDVIHVAIGRIKHREPILPWKSCSI